MVCKSSVNYNRFTLIVFILITITFPITLSRQIFVGNFCASKVYEASYLNKEQSESIWSANDVQQFIEDVGNNLKCTPNAAYTFAYKRMTKERDKARCGGNLSPKSFTNEIFNDALSDLMSRYYVNTWAVCNDDNNNNLPTGADLGNMWCNLANDSYQHNYNSIHVAMASTSIYLTTHMGLAVSALVQADNLWEEYSAYEVDTLEKRVDILMNEYEPLYDGFNVFLSEHLGTVEFALHDFGLTSGKIFHIASIIAEKANTPVGLVFEKIRTKTFQLGLQLGIEIPRQNHPLIVPCKSNSNHKKYCLRTSFAVPYSLNYATVESKHYKALIHHGKFWRRWLADGLGPIYKSMGGLDWIDLEKGSIAYNKCIEKVWKNKNM